MPIPRTPVNRARKRAVVELATTRQVALLGNNRAGQIIGPTPGQDRASVLSTAHSITDVGYFRRATHFSRAHTKLREVRTRAQYTVFMNDGGGAGTAGAVAATALTVAGAGAAIRYTRSSTRAAGAVSATALTVVGARAAILLASAGAAPGGAALGAVAATALVVLRTLLLEGLTLVVGSSYPPDAERCQRAPYEGCTHQPERLTSRQRTAGNSYSQLIEGAGSPIFSGHRLPLSPKGGTRQPRQLANATTLALGDESPMNSGPTSENSYSTH